MTTKLSKQINQTIELIEYHEELKFWKNHFVEIFLFGKVPKNLPDIISIKELIALLCSEQDYFAIRNRIKDLEFFIWGTPALRIVK